MNYLQELNTVRTVRTGKQEYNQLLDGFISGRLRQKWLYTPAKNNGNFRQIIHNLFSIVNSQ